MEGCQLNIKKSFNQKVTTNLSVNGERQPIRTLKEFEKYVKFGCKMRMNITLSKFWISEDNHYGVSLSLLDVDVEQKPKPNVWARVDAMRESKEKKMNIQPLEDKSPSAPPLEEIVY